MEPHLYVTKRRRRFSSYRVTRVCTLLAESWWRHQMETFGPLWKENTGYRWISLTEAGDAELWCFLWSAPPKSGWSNNRDAGDLKRHRTHYDVIVMIMEKSKGHILHISQLWCVFWFIAWFMVLKHQIWFYLHLLPVVAILVVWGFIRKPTSVSIIELSKIFHVTNKHKRLAFTEMFQPFKSVQLTTETQDGHHFADEIFMQFLDRKCLYLYSNVTEISPSSPWRFGYL